MWLFRDKDEELEDVPYTSEDVPDFANRQVQVQALDTSLLAGEDSQEMDQLMIQEAQVYDKEKEVCVHRRPSVHKHTRHKRGPTHCLPEAGYVLCDYYHCFKNAYICILK